MTKKPLNSEKSLLANNLLKKYQIMKSLEKIFYLLCNKNNILDAFSNLNRKSIPSNVFEPISFIIKNCNNRQRFICLNDFINKGIELFDKLKGQEQSLIINFN